jgi:hypothetical protein
MSKARKEGARAGALRALYEAGDHGSARRLAAELLADPAVGEEEREAALGIRARTRPDPFAAAAGGCGAVAAVAISLWLILH